LKIYTRTGDRGDTALFGGGRVRKTHPRVQAYGTVDELNSVLGRALTLIESSLIRERLAQVQHDLFALGAHLATPAPVGRRRSPSVPPLPDGRIQEMERWMDEAEAELDALRVFILPGGVPGAAELHVCRTVCRRAERMVVALEGAVTSEGDAEVREPAIQETVRYLNRLSDLFFVMARLENHRAGVSDIEWKKDPADGPSKDPAPAS
jgi:cob(I)alamin adenosyltransferase